MKILYENESCEVFPGFYNSYFENALDYDRCQDGFYLTFADWNQYKELVSEKYVDSIVFKYDNLIDMKILNYKGVWSPREYNFYTDRISFMVDVNMHRLKKYCFYEDCEEFNWFLVDRWTSRSSNVSKFLPRSVTEFVSRYQYSDKSERHKLQQLMIEFYLLRRVDFEEVESYVSEYCNELAYQSGVVLVDHKGNEYEWEYDNTNDVIIPVKAIELKIA